MAIHCWDCKIEVHGTYTAARESVLSILLQHNVSGVLRID